MFVSDCRTGLSLGAYVGQDQPPSESFGGGERGGGGVVVDRPSGHASRASKLVPPPPPRKFRNAPASVPEIDEGLATSVPLGLGTAALAGWIGNSGQSYDHALCREACTVLEWLLAWPFSFFPSEPS